MTFLSWLVRFIIVAVILRMVTRLFAGGRRQPGGRSEPKRVERAGGTLVKDPQCGDYVPVARAVVVGRGAEARYFCSTACRDQYLAAQGHRHAS